MDKVWTDVLLNSKNNTGGGFDKKAPVVFNFMVDNLIVIWCLVCFLMKIDLTTDFNKHD